MLNEQQSLLQVFHEINEAVVSQQESGKVLELILDKALGIVGVSIGWLSLVDEETGRLNILVSRGLPEEYKETRLKIGEGITGLVAETGELLNIPDVSADDRYYDLLDGIKSELCVPLTFHNKTIGVLNVESQDERAFSEEDEQVLITFANEAVIAIEIARTFQRTGEKLEQRVKELETLREIDKVLSSSLELDIVLNLILNKALQLTKTRGGAGLLQLVDKATGELVIRADRGLPDDVKNARLKIGEEGVTGWVAAKKQPALVENVTQDPRYISLIPNMKSELAVPLLIEDDLIGVLDLESPRLKAFDEDDVRLLQILAGQAVIAIQNAGQYEDLQKAHKELQEEQEKRIALEKWEALGQAAATLAHRLNNVIGIIPVCVAELSDLAGDDPLAGENLETIDRNAKFTLELAKSLLKPSIASPIGLFDINLLLRQALDVAPMPRHIKVITEYDDHLPEIQTKKLLVDAFVELITNAVKAMPRKGKLEISTKLVDDTWVEIYFTDTGYGIPVDMQDRIFELFVVAREGTEGTESLGFGLWWLRTFLYQQGGDIVLLKSEVGKGSTFAVRLPVNRGENSE